MSISSNNIKVYPTINREQKDYSAKFATEYNLTSILNKLLDRGAFVIKATRIDATKISIDFNIMGYFFSIYALDTSSYKNNYINATITVKEENYDSSNSNFKDWWTLQGTDTASGYTGLTLSSSDTSTLDSNDGITISSSGDNVTYSFTILEKINNTFEVPAKSKIKFETTTDGSKHSIRIDDGELFATQQPAMTYNVRRSAPIIYPEALNINTYNLHLSKEQLFRLTVQVTPQDANADITFTTSNAAVASVNNTGLITANSTGTCFIIVACGTVTATCQVTVK